MQENLRLKMKAKKEERQKIANKNAGTESGHSFGASGMKNTGMKFGTQIVNYQPNFVEESETDESQDNHKRADTYGKRTFTGSNFGGAGCQI